MFKEEEMLAAVALLSLLTPQVSASAQNVMLVHQESLSDFDTKNETAHTLIKLRGTAMPRKRRSPRLEHRNGKKQAWCEPETHSSNPSSSSAGSSSVSQSSSSYPKNSKPDEATQTSGDETDYYYD